MTLHDDDDDYLIIPTAASNDDGNNGECGVCENNQVDDAEHPPRFIASDDDEEADKKSTVSESSLITSVCSSTPDSEQLDDKPLNSRLLPDGSETFQEKLLGTILTPQYQFLMMPRRREKFVEITKTVTVTEVVNGASEKHPSACEVKVTNVSPAGPHPVNVSIKHLHERWRASNDELSRNEPTSTVINIRERHNSSSGAYLVSCRDKVASRRIRRRPASEHCTRCDRSTDNTIDIQFRHPSERVSTSQTLYYHSSSSSGSGSRTRIEQNDVDEGYATSQKKRSRSADTRESPIAPPRSRRSRDGSNIQRPTVYRDNNLNYSPLRLDEGNLTDNSIKGVIIPRAQSSPPTSHIKINVIGPTESDEPSPIVGYVGEDVTMDIKIHNAPTKPPRATKSETNDGQQSTSRRASRTPETPIVVVNKSRRNSQDATTEPRRRKSTVTDIDWYAAFNMKTPTTPKSPKSPYDIDGPTLSADLSRRCEEAIEKNQNEAIVLSEAFSPTCCSTDDCPCNACRVTTKDNMKKQPLNRDLSSSFTDKSHQCGIIDPKQVNSTISTQQKHVSQKFSFDTPHGSVESVAERPTFIVTRKQRAQEVDKTPERPSRRNREATTPKRPPRPSVERRKQTETSTDNLGNYTESMDKTETIRKDDNCKDNNETMEAEKKVEYEENTSQLRTEMEPSETSQYATIEVMTSNTLRESKDNRRQNNENESNIRKKTESDNDSTFIVEEDCLDSDEKSIDDDDTRTTGVKIISHEIRIVSKDSNECVDEEKHNDSVDSGIDKTMELEENQVQKESRIPEEITKRDNSEPLEENQHASQENNFGIDKKEGINIDDILSSKQDKLLPKDSQEIIESFESNYEKDKTDCGILACELNKKEDSTKQSQDHESLKDNQLLDSSVTKEVVHIEAKESIDTISHDSNRHGVIACELRKKDANEPSRNPEESEPKGDIPSNQEKNDSDTIPVNNSVLACSLQKNEPNINEECIDLNSSQLSPHKENENNEPSESVNPVSTDITEDDLLPDSNQLAKDLSDAIDQSLDITEEDLMPNEDEVDNLSINSSKNIIVSFDEDEEIKSNPTPAPRVISEVTIQLQDSPQDLKTRKRKSLENVEIKLRDENVNGEGYEPSPTRLSSEVKYEWIADILNEPEKNKFTTTSVIYREPVDKMSFSIRNSRVEPDPIDMNDIFGAVGSDDDKKEISCESKRTDIAKEENLEEKNEVVEDLEKVENVSPDPIDLDQVFSSIKEGSATDEKDMQHIDERIKEFEKNRRLQQKVMETSRTVESSKNDSNLDLDEIFGNNEKREAEMKNETEEKSVKEDNGDNSNELPASQLSMDDIFLKQNDRRTDETKNHESEVKLEESRLNKADSHECYEVNLDKQIQGKQYTKENETIPSNGKVDDNGESIECNDKPADQQNILSKDHESQKRISDGNNVNQTEDDYLIRTQDYEQHKDSLKEYNEAQEEREEHSDLNKVIESRTTAEDEKSSNENNNEFENNCERIRNNAKDKNAVDSSIVDPVTVPEDEKQKKESVNASDDKIDMSAVFQSIEKKKEEENINETESTNENDGNLVRHNVFEATGNKEEAQEKVDREYEPRQEGIHEIMHKHEEADTTEKNDSKQSIDSTTKQLSNNELSGDEKLDSPKIVEPINTDDEKIDMNEVFDSIKKKEEEEDKIDNEYAHIQERIHEFEKNQHEKDEKINTSEGVVDDSNVKEYSEERVSDKPTFESEHKSNDQEGRKPVLEVVLSMDDDAPTTNESTDLKKISSQSIIFSGKEEQNKHEDSKNDELSKNTPKEGNDLSLCHEASTDQNINKEEDTIDQLKQDEKSPANNITKQESVNQNDEKLVNDNVFESAEKKDKGDDKIGKEYEHIRDRIHEFEANDEEAMHQFDKAETKTNDDPEERMNIENSSMAKLDAKGPKSEEKVLQREVKLDMDKAFESIESKEGYGKVDKEYEHIQQRIHEFEENHEKMKNQQEEDGKNCHHSVDKEKETSNEKEIMSSATEVTNNLDEKPNYRKESINPDDVNVQELLESIETKEEEEQIVKERVPKNYEEIKKQNDEDQKKENDNSSENNTLLIEENANNQIEEDEKPCLSEKNESVEIIDCIGKMDVDKFGKEHELVQERIQEFEENQEEIKTQNEQDEKINTSEAVVDDSNANKYSEERISATLPTFESEHKSNDQEGDKPVLDTQLVSNIDLSEEEKTGVKTTEDYVSSDDEKIDMNKVFDSIEEKNKNEDKIDMEFEHIQERIHEFEENQEKIKNQHDKDEKINTLEGVVNDSNVNEYSEERVTDKPTFESEHKSNDQEGEKPVLDTQLVSNIDLSEEEKTGVKTTEDSVSSDDEKIDMNKVFDSIEENNKNEGKIDTEFEHIQERIHEFEENREKMTNDEMSISEKAVDETTKTNSTEIIGENEYNNEKGKKSTLEVVLPIDDDSSNSNESTDLKQTSSQSIILREEQLEPSKTSEPCFDKNNALSHDPSRDELDYQKDGNENEEETRNPNSEGMNETSRSIETISGSNIKLENNVSESEERKNDDQNKSELFHMEDQQSQEKIGQTLADEEVLNDEKIEQNQEKTIVDDKKETGENLNIETTLDDSNVIEENGCKVYTNRDFQSDVVTTGNITIDSLEQKDCASHKTKKEGNIDENLRVYVSDVSTSSLINKEEDVEKRGSQYSSKPSNKMSDVSWVESMIQEMSTEDSTHYQNHENVKQQSNCFEIDDIFARFENIRSDHSKKCECSACRLISLSDEQLNELKRRWNERKMIEAHKASSSPSTNIDNSRGISNPSPISLDEVFEGKKKKTVSFQDDTNERATRDHQNKQTSIGKQFEEMMRSANFYDDTSPGFVDLDDVFKFEHLDSKRAESSGLDKIDQRLEEFAKNRRENAMKLSKQDKRENEKRVIEDNISSIIDINDIFNGERDMRSHVGDIDLDKVFEYSPDRSYDSASGDMSHIDERVKEFEKNRRDLKKHGMQEQEAKVQIKNYGDGVNLDDIFGKSSQSKEQLSEQTSFQYLGDKQGKESAQKRVQDNTELNMNDIFGDPGIESTEKVQNKQVEKTENEDHNEEIISECIPEENENIDVPGRDNKKERKYENNLKGFECNNEKDQQIHLENDCNQKDEGTFNMNDIFASASDSYKAPLKNDSQSKTLELENAQVHNLKQPESDDGDEYFKENDGSKKDEGTLNLNDIFASASDSYKSPLNNDSQSKTLELENAQVHNLKQPESDDGDEYFKRIIKESPNDVVDEQLAQAPKPLNEEINKNHTRTSLLNQDRINDNQRILKEIPETTETQDPKAALMSATSHKISEQNRNSGADVSWVESMIRKISQTPSLEKQSPGGSRLYTTIIELDDIFTKFECPQAAGKSKKCECSACQLAALSDEQLDQLKRQWNERKQIKFAEQVVQASSQLSGDRTNRKDGTESNINLNDVFNESLSGYPAESDKTRQTGEDDAENILEERTSAVGVAYEQLIDKSDERKKSEGGHVRDDPRSSQSGLFDFNTMLSETPDESKDRCSKHESRGKDGEFIDIKEIYEDKLEDSLNREEVGELRECKEHESKNSADEINLDEIMDAGALQLSENRTELNDRSADNNETLSKSSEGSSKEVSKSNTQEESSQPLPDIKQKDVNPSWFDFDKILSENSDQSEINRDQSIAHQSEIKDKGFYMPKDSEANDDMVNLDLNKPTCTIEASIDINDIFNEQSLDMSDSSKTVAIGNEKNSEERDGMQDKFDFDRMISDNLNRQERLETNELLEDEDKTPSDPRKVSENVVGSFDFDKILSDDIAERSKESNKDNVEQQISSDVEGQLVRAESDSIQEHNKNTDDVSWVASMIRKVSNYKPHQLMSNETPILSRSVFELDDIFARFECPRNEKSKKCECSACRLTSLSDEQLNELKRQWNERMRSKEINSHEMNIGSKLKDNEMFDSVIELDDVFNPKETTVNLELTKNTQGHTTGSFIKTEPIECRLPESELNLDDIFSLSPASDDSGVLLHRAANESLEDVREQEQLDVSPAEPETTTTAGQFFTDNIPSTSCESHETLDDNRDEEFLEIINRPGVFIIKGTYSLVISKTDPLGKLLQSVYQRQSHIDFSLAPKLKRVLMECIKEKANGKTASNADKLSTRGEYIHDSVDHAAVTFAKMNANKYDPIKNPDGVINFCTAENNICTPLLEEHFKHLDLFIPNLDHLVRYPPTTGWPDALEALSKYFAEFMKAKVDVSEMVLTASTRTGYDVVSQCLFEADDVLLTNGPVYSGTVANVNERALCVCETVDCDLENPGTLSIAKYEEALAEMNRQQRNVGGIIIINPHNPLGSVFPPEQVIELCNWAARNGLHVIMDEVFSNCVFDDDARYQPYLSYRHRLLHPENVVYLWSLSKDFGMPGLKFAVIHSPNEALIKAASKLYLYHPCSPFVSDFAVKLLSDFDWVRSFHAEVRRRIKIHYKFTSENLRRLGLPFIEAHAGIFTLIDFRKYVNTVDEKGEIELWTRMFEESKVMLSAGVHHKCSIPGWIRIVYACSKEELYEGFRRLYKFLKSEYSEPIGTIEY